MIPIIEREIVEKRNWIKHEDLADLVSLAGSAPGGVGINAAAFIGYRKAGIAGAAASVSGITCPTFIIVLTLSLFYLMFHDHPKLEAALKGVHGAIVALILVAAYRMAKAAVFDVSTAILSVSTLVVLLVLHVNPLYVITIGIIAGIILIKGKEWRGINAFTEKKAVNNQKAVIGCPEYYI